MQRVLSRAQGRDFDRLATEVCQVPSLVLMENAGRGAVEAIAASLGDGIGPDSSVLVVCGNGNNGGDGYVVARRLGLLGARVEVLSLGPEGALSGDALRNYRAFRGVGGRVAVLPECDASALDALFRGRRLIVDALFGTGLDRPLAPPLTELIARINAAEARRVALDLPSGLDADTGVVHGAAVRADVTVSFGAHKLGLLTPSGLAHAGRVVIKDIGLPLSALSQVGESAWLLEPADAARALPPRAANAHKVSSGRVLVIGGSRGKTGAPLLTARGALRAGAGLVTLAALPEVFPHLAGRVLEAMTACIDPERLEETLEPLLAQTGVVAIGPGFGLDEVSARVVERVVLRHTGTVVADADALTLFGGRLAALAERAGNLILTPHPGEMARLLGLETREVEADRYAALKRAVELGRAVVLLKGPHTLISAPGERVLVGPASTPALATGGAGDVLTGVIAGLACSVAPFVAAWAGVFVHGVAAERWARRTRADRGLLAREVADRIPRVFAELSAGTAPLTD
jgi:NAD(P)H-hydrate epimerase